MHPVRLFGLSLLARSALPCNWPLLVVLIVGVAGCHGPKTPLAVYDNKGGYAYGGYRITFYNSGHYELEAYTDVLSDKRDLRKGTFQRKDSKYILSGEDGQSIYRVVIVNGVESLLDERTYKNYIQTKDVDKLRHPLQRVR